MLGWDIANLNIGQGGGIARTFDFEVVFNTGTKEAECVLRGDGIVLSSGRVRFNREDEIGAVVAGTGGNPRYFLEYLADVVARQATEPQPRTS